MLYISEMDGRARELARERGLGLELIEFCAPERLEDGEYIVRMAQELKGCAAVSLHAPYAEIFPCAVDPEARALARRRLLRAGEVCARIGAKRMIAHSGCAPRLYFPEWYVPKSIEFWRELLRALPEGVELLLENVLDPEPAELAAIIDGVGDPRLGACLDVGHANVYSPRSALDWIAALNGRVRHVHLHNNGGSRDEHAPLGEGELDIPAFLAKLRDCAPAADWCIESRDAAACLEYLSQQELLKETLVCNRLNGASAAMEGKCFEERASSAGSEFTPRSGTSEETSVCSTINKQPEPEEELMVPKGLDGKATRDDTAFTKVFPDGDRALTAGSKSSTRSGTLEETPVCSCTDKPSASDKAFDASGNPSGKPTRDTSSFAESSPDENASAAPDGRNPLRAQKCGCPCTKGAAQEDFPEKQTEVQKPLNLSEIQIPALSADAMAAAEARQRMLAKPPGSLGVLEEISIRFAGMTGRERNRSRRRRLLVFAADNGVTAEGVSSAPKSVTLAQTVNLARGMTGAATLARHFGTELRVYDVGVDAPGPLGGGVAHRRIANGTRNLAVGPAMTRGEVLAALRVGWAAAEEAADAGVELIGIGEMGIGNTTTSAAVLAALLDLPAEVTVGRGGGVSDAGFARKREIVDAAVARLDGSKDAVEVLAEVGGLDIAAMCGAFIGAAARRLPAVIDGYISVVAALCAERLAPGCRNYMFASHASWERGYARAIEALGLKPMLALEMRLGEGSGCPIAFEVIDAALMVHDEMATFEQARIDDGYLSEIRSNTRLQR